MYVKILRSVFLMIILLAGSAWAQKDDGQQQSLSEYCPSCDYTISDAATYHDGFATHSFTINSNTRQVNHIEVTLKITSTGTINYELVSIFEDYFQLDSTRFVAGNDTWLNFTWTNVTPTVFDGDELFQLKLSTTECLAVTDSFLVEITDWPDISFYNFFFAQGQPNNAITPAKIDGYQFRIDPEATASVIGDFTPRDTSDHDCPGQYPGDVDESGDVDISDLTKLTIILAYNNYSALPSVLQNADVNGDCLINQADEDRLIDHLFGSLAPLPDCGCDEMPQFVGGDILGGIVSVPIYARDVNFEYSDFAIMVTHQPGLTFVGTDTTQYASEIYVSPVNDTTNFYSSYGIGSTPVDLPGSTELFRINYLIDSTVATPENYYHVVVDSTYTFWNCVDYVDTGFGDVAVALVEALVDPSRCYTCDYDISNDVIEYRTDEITGTKPSVHSFTFESGGMPVDSAEVSIKVTSTDTLGFQVTNAPGTYTSASYIDGDDTWIDITFRGMNGQVYTGNQLFTLTLRTTECLEVGETIGIEIIGNLSQGYLNQFWSAASQTGMSLNALGSGTIGMVIPNAVASVLGIDYDSLGSNAASCGYTIGDINGSGNIDISDLTDLTTFLMGETQLTQPLQVADLDTNCLVNQDDLDYLSDYMFGGGPAPGTCSCDELLQVVDSSTVGGLVNVPVYMRDINYDIDGVAYIRLKYDPALTFESWTSTTHTSNWNKYEGHDSTVYFTSPGYASIKLDPGDLPAVLLTAQFRLDTLLTTAGELYSVQADDYLFAGCGLYLSADTGDIEPAWVKASFNNSICYDCEFALSSDLIEYDLDAAGMKTSQHSFTVNSNSQAVDSLEATLKVNSADAVSFTIDNGSYPAPVVDTVTDGGAFYINLKWTGLSGAVFAGETLFSLTLNTAQCLPVQGSISIDITHNDSNGYYNGFYTGGSWQAVIDLNGGLQSVVMSEIRASLWSDDDVDTAMTSCPDQSIGDVNGDGRIADIGDITDLTSFLFLSGTAPEPLQNADFDGNCVVDSMDVEHMIDYAFRGEAGPVDCSCEELEQVVDSALVGETVSLPVYLRDINFDYRDGFTLKVAHDPELVYQSVTTTSYSTSATGSDPTGSEVTVTLGANSIDAPAAFPDTLLFVNFLIDANAGSEPGALYEVSIVDDYLFKACLLYGSLGIDSLPPIWLKARWDLASYCPECVLSLGNDTAYFEVDTLDMVSTTHALNFNSDGEQVDRLEVTFKLTGPSAVSASALGGIAQAPDSISIVQVGLDTWVNMIWSSVSGAVFDNELAANVTFNIEHCFGAGSNDSLTIEISENDSLGFYTNYDQTSGTTRHVVGRNSGYSFRHEPFADLFLGAVDNSPGHVADSGLASDSVCVPVQFADINFDYNSFEVYVAWDQGLTFDSIQTNAYSVGATYSTLGSDSILVTIDTSSSTILRHPETLPDTLLKLWFTIDGASASPGDDIQVRFSQDYTVMACPSYKSSGSYVDEYVYVRYSDTTICSNCSYALSDDAATYSGNGGGIDFYSDFSFNSSGEAVDEMDVTFKIHSSAISYVVIDSMYLASSPAVIYNEFTEGEYFWVHINITGLGGEVFTGNTLFRLLIGTTECRPPGETIDVTFDDHIANGYYNNFVSSGNIRRMLQQNKQGCDLWFVEPFLHLSLMDRSDTLGAVVGTGWVGGQVSVPVYIDSINYDYNYNYSVVIAHDTALEASSITTTAYSGSNPSIAWYDDSVVVTGIGPATHPDTPAVMFYVNFDFEVGRSIPESCYQLSIMNYSYVLGCSQYGDTTNSSSEYVNVCTAKEEATLAFGNVTMLPGYQNKQLNILMKNSVPIATDALYDIVNLRFAFDTASLSYTSYESYSVRYYIEEPDDSLVWEMETFDPGQNPNQVLFEESHIMPSTVIEPSDVLRTIGYLVIDAGLSEGTDIVNFVKITDTLHPQFLDDNYAVVKHTGNTLRYIDSIISGVTYYGDLTLESGTATVEEFSLPGCPMLYSWNGLAYVEEDFILTQSHGKNEPQPTADYYPIEFGVIDDDGLYSIEIHEFENEITYLDQLELISVDYPTTSRVGISNAGKVYTYAETVLPVAAVDETGADVLPLVSHADRNFFEKEGPGSLILTYQKPSSKNNNSFALGLGDDGGSTKKEGGGLESGDDAPIIDDKLTAEIEDANGSWHDLGVVPPRQNLAGNCTFFFDGNNTELGETFRVRISWENNFQTDVQELLLDDGANLFENRLMPAEAVHSAAGKAVAQLALVDDDVVTIQPGQNIRARFRLSDQEIAPNHIRKYFLKAHGYFKVFSSGDLLPEHFELYHNYPNPFNPSTTIKFSLPVGGHVSMVVYNVLGQEVKNLHNGFIDAGVHEIVWDGNNNSGASVASGVYFYRMNTGGFEKTRKMTLIK